MERAEIREWLLSCVDISDAVIDAAIYGTVDTRDLWWLYETKQVMSDGSAWLLAMMWEEADDSLSELLGSSSFWEWYDRGRLGKQQQSP